MISTMILTWIFTIATFLIGFAVGRYLAGENVVENVRRRVQERIKPPQVGAVNKPKPEDLVNKGTILEQNEQAMEELLDSEIGGE